MLLAPLRCDIPSATLDELRRRIFTPRGPEATLSGDRLGVDPQLVRRVCEHWAGTFDWPQAQQQLNAWPKARVTVGGLRLHVLLAQSGNILQVRRPETRRRRVEETARLAADGVRANQPRKPTAVWT